LKANPNANRLLLLAQIAAGLEYLHTSDPAVIHGDLKAANIFISKTGKPCIGDFGLSGNDIPEGTENSTSSNWIISSAFKYGGNVRWQAPELWEDHQRTTFSDVFAFGRVIYEVYTGQVPFAHMPTVGICLAVYHGKLPPTSDGFNDQMWRLMARCCNHYPKERPTAPDILRCLRPDNTTNTGAGEVGSSAGGKPGVVRSITQGNLLRARGLPTTKSVPRAGRTPPPPPPPAPAMHPKPKVPKYRAVFNFDGEGGEMSLRKDDLVELIRKDDNGWWLINKGGQEGWSPSNYLEPA